MKRYYFPHDYQARENLKIVALINKFGYEGLGIYWCLIEILHEEDGKIEKFIDLYGALSKKLGISQELLESIISYLVINAKLLQEDDRRLTCDRVITNLNIMEKKRLIRVEAGRKGGIQKWNNIKHNPSIAISKSKQSLPNEIKIKEKKVYKSYGEFGHVKLTEEEINKLEASLGKETTQVWIKKLDEGIELKGYSYKNCYLAILNWLKRDKPVIWADKTTSDGRFIIR